MLTLTLILNCAYWYDMVFVEGHIFPVAAISSGLSLISVAVGRFLKRKENGSTFATDMFALFCLMVMIIEIGRVRS
jgi:hypothetical protein